MQKRVIWKKKKRKQTRVTHAEIQGPFSAQEIVFFPSGENEQSFSQVYSTVEPGKYLSRFVKSAFSNVGGSGHSVKKTHKLVRVKIKKPEVSYNDC